MIKQLITIPLALPDLSGNEKKYLDDCLFSSWISSKGKYITQFENSFASFIGTRYAVATSNGTVSLHLALVSLGIGPGDEVLVPDLTFIATANAVIYTGAKAILVDCEKKTWGMSPQDLEQKITKKTKAVIVVHLYGRIASMNEILAIVRRHNLKIIEDAAEAHGGQVRIEERNGKDHWEKVGSLGDLGCFSFYGNKIITTGEGGMVTTNDSFLIEKLRILRDHGQDPKRKYYHPIVGFNYRMTNIQAAIGCAQLEKIDIFLKKRNKIMKTYNNSLVRIAGITPHPSDKKERSVVWMYSLLIDKPYKLTRDQLMEKLTKEGIECRPFFYPLHTLPPYRENTSYPSSTYLSQHGMNLPTWVDLAEEDIKKIASVIRSFA